MEIQILAVGRVKGGFKYSLVGVEEYIKRLRPYVTVKIIEIADEAVTPSKTSAQIMAQEAERILPYMEKAGYTVALSERGQSLDSVAFSEALGECLGLVGLTSSGFKAGEKNVNPPNGGMRKKGSGPMMFVVGGALGLSSTILNRADWIVSLSPMTYPHQLVRLILMEQLYRAFRILRNEPYHK